MQEISFCESNRIQLIRREGKEGRDRGLPKTEVLLSQARR